MSSLVCNICDSKIQDLCYNLECIRINNCMYVSTETTICNYLYTKRRNEEFLFILKLIKQSLDKYNLVDIFNINKDLSDIPNLDIISNAKSKDINVENISKITINVINEPKNKDLFEAMEYKLFLELGSDTYGFVKNALKKSNLSITYDKEISDNTKIKGVYKVDYSSDTKEDTIYLYHGSGTHNWFSIIYNGLQIFSNTSRMTNGRAYGDGIYLSNSAVMSSTYSSKGLGENDYVIGVFEVKNYAKYKKANSIYVVNNTEDVKLKYLFNLTRMNRNSIEEIGSYFSKNKKKADLSVKTYIGNLKNKRLLMEYNNIMKNKEKNTEFVLEETDNLETWNVKLINIDADSNLSKDMKTLDIDCIEMEIKFTSYPIKPPSVRIIKPSFIPMTGHITHGGSICFELLTNQGWTPAILMETLFIHIKAIISEDGRLNGKYNKEYTERNADAGRARFMRAHGWS